METLPENGGSLGAQVTPYLAQNGGKYIAVQHPTGISERSDKRMEKFRERHSDTAIYGDILFSVFGDGSSDIAPDNSVDVLLTFRNGHNWLYQDYYDQAMNDFYAALKPGGILGMVQHRAPEADIKRIKKRSGYLKESFLIEAAEHAGFEFIASSEINANPKDTTDHPMGVWTLPPRSEKPKKGSEEAADFDSSLYKSIGESDRATLKFRKPE